MHCTQKSYSEFLATPLNMKFWYKAATQDGRTIQGVVDAKQASEVASYLRAREFFPINITVKKDADVFRLIPFLNRVGKPDIVLFTRQLASILTSGLTLIESLNILYEQVTQSSMKEIIREVVADIEEGKSFSQALAKYPDVFFPIYISLIQSSEKAGLLDKILLRLADNLEKQERLRGAIKSALVYPAIVVAGMVIVMIIMMLFVVPQLSTIYISLNVELPFTTRVIIWISNNFIAFWPFMLGIGGLLFFAFRRWHQTEAGKLILDDLILRLPVFGKLIRETILAEFTRTLGLLIGAGTLVIDALKETADVAGNSLYKNAVLGVTKQVEKGVGIGDSLSGYSLFPPIVASMAKIGEQTGKLDDSLIKVSEYFEREVDMSTKTLTTALEPIIMIILGFGVAFLIISIITPIYSLTNAIH